MGPILDSQGRPVSVHARSIRESFDSRNTPLTGGTAPGMTMLSRFAGNQQGDIGKFRKLAADIQTANPAIRSPLLNQSNFYMPESDASTGEPNRLLNQWITYYKKWNGLVGNLLDAHAEIPLSRFALRGVEDPKIAQFYEDMTESMELHLKCVELLRQFFTYGEVIPFAFWNDNYNCFTDLTFLDNNYVYVKGHYLLHSDEGDDVEFYELEPDPMLINLVKSDDYVTKRLRTYLDDDFVAAVRQNKRLLLSNFSTYMIRNKIRWADLRGTSIVLRCLKSLLYRDKLAEANYVIADGHINPKWLWKLGQAGDLATGGYMPTEEDLSSFRDLLVSANNDPMFTIITHYAVAVEAVGLNGKLLPINQEYQQIESEILTALFSNKAMTTGDGPNFACYDENTETLTDNGFKKIDDITDEDKIATFNPVNEQLEYHLPMSKHIYDYDSARDGKMVHFKTGKIDCMVTPNHRMYTRTRWNKGKDGAWKIMRADEVGPRAEFRSQVKWAGAQQDVPAEVKRLFGANVTLADWCTLVGYYVSEGWTAESAAERTQVVGIRQMHTSAHYKHIKDICVKFGFNVYKDSFGISGKERVAYFNANFGKGCLNKKLPKWIKNLPTPYLSILLSALVDGDGSRRAATTKKQTDKQYYTYCSTSKTLIDDVFEIVYKLGNVPRLTADKKVPEKHNRRYYVQWSDADSGKFPTLEAKRLGKGIKTIYREDYKGRVYCFEVPNHLFITRRNGLVTIQGNTASVAFRAMMSRYIPIRAKVERYLYQKIFAPVAYANKFYKRKAADLAHGVRTGNEETNRLIIPTIDWRSKSNLLDDGSIKSIISSMVATGRLPMKILTESLDLDYEEVRSYLYSEQASVFDPVAIEGRKKISGANTDETMIGQPFIPKQNQPVSTKARRGEAATPQTKKAASKGGAYSKLLSLKPLGAGILDVAKVPDLTKLPEAKADPIQTQINKGKVEKGGDPAARDPMAESLKLEAGKKSESTERVFDVLSDTQNKRMVNKTLVGKNYKGRKISQKNALIDKPVEPPKQKHERTLAEVAAEVASGN